MTLRLTASLMEAAPLGLLQQLLLEVVPRWCERCSCYDGERLMRVDFGQADALRGALVDERARSEPRMRALAQQLGSTGLPSSRGCSLELRGPKLTVFVHANERLLLRQSGHAVWLWGNSVSFQVRGAKDADGLCERLLLRAGELLDPVYGSAMQQAERTAKNILSDEHGTRAVGLSALSGLPGIYGLNLLGTVYVDAFGRDVLEAAPCAWRRRAGGAVLLARDVRSDAWQSEQARELEHALRVHLGADWIFDRAEPDRLLKCPAALQTLATR